MTFCLINQLCITYPKLFGTTYFYTLIQGFFEIEPFKNLYMI